MPFLSYDSYDKIPEGLGRDNFRQGKDGKWHPIVHDEHPLVKKKNDLLTTNTDLTGQNTSLKDKAVPPGHRIVPVADFTLLEVIRGLGVNNEEIKTRLTEYPTLKQKETEAARETSYDNAGKFLKYDNLAAFKTAMKLGNVEIVWKKETVDGKEIEVPYVGEKKLADHIVTDESLKTMEPFFKMKPQVTPPKTEIGAGNRASTGGSGGGQGAGNGGAGAGSQENTQPQQQPQEKTYRFQNAGDVAWPE